MIKFYDAMNTLCKPKQHYKSWGHGQVPAVGNTLELVQKRSVNNFAKKTLEYFCSKATFLLLNWREWVIG